MILDTNDPIQWIGMGTTLGVTFVAGAGAAYKGIKWFAAAWIDDRFKRKLATLEQDFRERSQKLQKEQDEALKHIQSTIDHQIHRAKKLYDTEFEVLTKAWLLLEELHGHAIASIASPPIYAEWDSATSPVIRRILDEETAFTDPQKTRIVDAEDSVDEFRVVYDEIRLASFQATLTEYGHYLGSHGIFMRPEIRERFKKMSILFVKVVTEFARDLGQAKPHRPEYINLMREGNPIRKELQALIEARLWSAAAPDMR